MWFACVCGSVEIALDHGWCAFIIIDCSYHVCYDSTCREDRTLLLLTCAFIIRGFQTGLINCEIRLRARSQAGPLASEFHACDSLAKKYEPAALASFRLRSVKFASARKRSQAIVAKFIM